MSFGDITASSEKKMRIIQEMVPGKQVTLAHVIAADIAMKRANIDMGFIDRFSGTLIYAGKVADVENSIIEINAYLKGDTLHYHKTTYRRTFEFEGFF